MKKLALTRLAAAALLSAPLFAICAAPGGAQNPAAAREPARAAADEPTLEEFARRDHIVAAVLELPRETTAQKLRTVIRLIDLGHPEVASRILPEVLAAELDDAARAALVREFGSARFMKLIRLDPTAAAGASQGDFAGAREFAQRCLDAASAESRNPERLAQLIAQLSAPDEDDRYAARVDLQATGDPGIIACFAALAAAPNEQVRTEIMAALAEMRPAVDEPVIAVLAEARDQFRRDAAVLAGQLRLGAALPWLSALAAAPPDRETASAAAAALTSLGIPTPTPAQAQALIQRKLDSLSQQPIPTGPGEPDSAWWSLDATTQSLTSTPYTPRQLRALATARLTHALAEAGGLSQPENLLAAVIAGWEEAAILKREPSDLQKQRVSQLTPAELSAALAESVGESRFAAAAQAAAELGRRGDASVLATSDGRPSPLAGAVSSPVRELRFAALSAIMELSPPRSFPGASYVPTALWHFAAGAGEPLAIVAAPAYTRASDWAGQLRAVEYQAIPVATGRNALLASLEPATSARLAIVVLDSDIGQPTLGETIYQLRASERTARTPVLVCASVPSLQSAQRLAASDPLILVAPRPDGEGAFAALVERTMALSVQPRASVERRREQAAQALQWIAKLLADGGPYDELLRDSALVNQTLFAGDLTEPSLRVLAVTGTAASQSALVDYASSPTLPVEARRQAVASLAANVKRHGSQLSAQQILRQYDRYNASETADADTQQVLGQILDVLEKK